MFVNKRGVFVLGCILYKYQDTVYFGELAHQQTVELCRPFLSEMLIIARCREVSSPPISQKSLSETGANLAMEIPDYGAKGTAGWINLASLFLSITVLLHFNRFIRDSDFIYIEAPSLEGFLAAIFAKLNRKKLTMETRGTVLLNYDYMKHRFGFLGLVWTLLYQVLFKFVRNQANAGLYVSQSLMAQYPIAGSQMCAISDVRLDDNMKQEPRMYNNPAARFIYVGHLEKIKRVDVIIRALTMIKKDLDQNWVLQIIGDGPENTRLHDLVADLKVNDHIRFEGRVPWGQSLFKYYLQADILLMASLSEGNSRTLIEAMFFALPVVSTKVGTASELLPEEALVSPQNISEYAAKVLEIASNPQQLTEYSLNNYQNAKPFQFSKLLARRQDFLERAIISTELIPQQ